MGLFDILKKKTTTPQAAPKQQQKTVDNSTTIKPTEKKDPSVDNRPWVDKYYMSGYDVGEIKGYTDLLDKPRSEEEGSCAVLKWKRYENIIIVTGLTTKKIETVNIPQTINGYVVAGIERMAFLHCSIESVVIPETVKYIGGMAVGFASKSAFSDDEERKIREKKPFAENWPTSPFMNKDYFLHISPKTTIIGKANSIAEQYAKSHYLMFSQN